MKGEELKSYRNFGQRDSEKALEHCIIGSVLKVERTWTCGDTKFIEFLWSNAIYLFINMSM